MLLNDLAVARRGRPVSGTSRLYLLPPKPCWPRKWLTIILAHAPGTKVKAQGLVFAASCVRLPTDCPAIRDRVSPSARRRGWLIGEHRIRERKIYLANRRRRLTCAPLSGPHPALLDFWRAAHQQFEKKNLVSITSRADPGRAFTVMRS